MKNIFINKIPVDGKENSESTDFFHIYVHPYFIKNIPHIIYPRGLAEKSPGIFGRLKNYYQQQGYALKKDQRSDNPAGKAGHERRKWAPILLFTVSIFFESSAFADVEVDLNQAILDQSQRQVELQIVSSQDIRSRIRSHLGAQLHQRALAERVKQTRLNSPLADSLFHILVSRYQEQKNDPGYIVDDLKKMANYYSEFPEVIALLESLKEKAGHSRLMQTTG